MLFSFWFKKKKWKRSPALRRHGVGFRYDHFPKEEVLRLSVLGWLQEVQCDGDAVHRRNSALPLQRTQGNGTPRRVVVKLAVCPSLLWLWDDVAPQKNNEKNHRVRIAIGNGVRTDVWSEFLKRFGDIKVRELYAATEGNIGFVNYTSKVGAVGRVNVVHKVSSECRAGRPNFHAETKNPNLITYLQNISMQMLWIKIEISHFIYCFSFIVLLSLHFDQVWHREGGARPELWGSVRWGSQRWASFPGGRIHDLCRFSFVKCYFSGAGLLVRYDPGFRPWLTSFMHVSIRWDGTLGGKGYEEVSVCRLRRKPAADWEEAASRRLEKRRFVLQHRRFAPRRSRELCLLPRPSRRHLQVSFLLFFFLL